MRMRYACLAYAMMNALAAQNVLVYCLLLKLADIALHRSRLGSKNKNSINFEVPKKGNSF